MGLAMPRGVKYDEDADGKKGKPLEDETGLRKSGDGASWHAELVCLPKEDGGNDESSLTELNLKGSTECSEDISIPVDPAKQSEEMVLLGNVETLLAFTLKDKAVDRLEVGTGDSDFVDDEWEPALPSSFVMSRISFSGDCHTTSCMHGLLLKTRITR